MLIIAAAMISLGAGAGTGPGTAGQNQRNPVQEMLNALDAPGGLLESSSWGFVAMTMKGEPIAKIHENKRLVPASNMKLITTGVALAAYGGNYRMNTRFATDGEIKDSTLAGNLYIIGGGDPILGELFSYLPGRDFRKWRDALVAAGITRISGDIIGDGSYFKGERHHGDWSIEDEQTKDGVVPCGLTWRGEMGDSIPDGAYAAALHFKEWLDADSTITVDGRPLEGIAPEGAKAIAAVNAPPLREITALTNHWSDNFCAETLLKLVGLKYKASDEYGPCTTALKDAMATFGLKEKAAGMRFADGSGLSRKNYVTPGFMADYLLAIGKSRWYRDFLYSLPQPGRPDGTLKNRMQGYSDRGRIYMKSGTMNGVRCYSGYILSGDRKSDRTIIFSFLVNNFVGDNHNLWITMDRVIATLAERNK